MLQNNLNNLNSYHVSADLENLTLSSPFPLLKTTPSCEFQSPAVFYLLQYPLFPTKFCPSICFK